MIAFVAMALFCWPYCIAIGVQTFIPGNNFGERIFSFMIAGFYGVMPMAFIQ